jgi:hypothetical protein
MISMRLFSLYKVFISILGHKWDDREKQCVTTFKRTLSNECSLHPKGKGDQQLHNYSNWEILTFHLFQRYDSDSNFYLLEQYIFNAKYMNFILFWLLLSNKIWSWLILSSSVNDISQFCIFCHVADIFIRIFVLSDSSFWQSKIKCWIVSSAFPQSKHVDSDSSR